MSNFIKSILNKKSSLQEKYLYLFSALISILYLFYQFYFSLFLIWGNSYLYHASISIFIFNSILILFKNYSISKKLELTSFPLFLIIFFWSYDLLIGFDYGIKYSIILIFQIYLFLNLYLDKKFNILSIIAVSSNNSDAFNINKIVNKFKSSTLGEKIFYFFPLILSLFFLSDMFLHLFGFDIFFRKIFSGEFKHFIFIISSAYCAYVSYSHHKKITSIAILFSYICFYWIIRPSLSGFLLSSQIGIYFALFIGYLNLFLQIYLYLIFFLDDKIDFKNLTNKISSNK